jgi:hypothetical protein
MSSNSTRAAFLEAVNAAGRLLRAPEVARGWDQPSALAELSVRGLAGHLVRSAVQTERYLDGPEPDGPTVNAAQYFAIVVATDDISAPEHQSVRARGEEQAAGGHAALVAELDAVTPRLTRRLVTEPETRRVRVAHDLVLVLDQYLCTRIVELAVHADDLAVSVGVDPPHLDADVAALAIDTLVEVARVRHGDGAVLRALARRERDPIHALRVL